METFSLTFKESQVDSQIKSLLLVLPHGLGGHKVKEFDFLDVSVSLSVPHVLTSCFVILDIFVSFSWEDAEIYT